MEKNENSDILLTFYDVTIRQRDIDCLNPGCWLNDICIAFYYQYLKEASKNDFIYLMDPAVVALLVYEEDPEMIFYGLDLKQFQCILIPINDNDDKRNIAGGSHWSLLNYLVQEDVFIYYDSMKKRSSNIENAKKVAKKLRMLIKGGLDELADMIIIEKEAPQQKNGFDCGIYVLAVTEILIQCLIKKEKIFGNKILSEIINEEYITNLRVKIKAIIDEFKKK